MNVNIHTLTAYRLEFSYMKRNNPLKEDLVEEIKNDLKPTILIDDFLNTLINKSENQDYESLSSNGKVFILEQIIDKEITKNNCERIYIKPLAGKTNEPIHMVNLKENKKVYDFGKDWASTYSHNLFIYKIDSEYYVVCHRHGGSGCKTVFQSVCNKMLKEKGIKMQMNWMPPILDESDDQCNIEKITLICKESVSSDEADELVKKNKKFAVKKELTLNLNRGFNGINSILHKYQIKEISKEIAMNEIKNEVNDSDYNSASLLVKIGQAKKKVSWDDFEGLIDGFDITDKLANTGNKFIPVLKQCSDDFLFELLEK